MEGDVLAVAKGMDSSVTLEAAELLLEVMGEARRRQPPVTDPTFTFAQAAVLCNVDQTPQPMSALAKLLNCDNSTITGHVDKLEARGMVRRVTSTQDRRVKLVSLTDKGRVCRAKGREILLAEGQRWISLLDESDQRALVELLRRGRERLKSTAE